MEGGSPRPESGVCLASPAVPRPQAGPSPRWQAADVGGQTCCLTAGPVKAQLPEGLPALWGGPKPCTVLRCYGRREGGTGAGSGELLLGRSMFLHKIPRPQSFPVGTTLNPCPFTLPCLPKTGLWVSCYPPIHPLPLQRTPNKSCRKLAHPAPSPGTTSVPWGVRRSNQVGGGWCLYPHPGFGGEASVGTAGGQRST